MDRRRPSAPFGNPAWLELSGADLSLEVDRYGNRIEPELFRMIHRFRVARVRLVVESVLLVGAVVLFFVLPTIGTTIVGLIVLIPWFFDLLLVVNLRRRITEAWEDLALAPEGDA